MPVDFTAEQQAEIDKMLKAAKAQEQYKIAGLQAFRESLAHMDQLIDKYDMTQNPPRLVKQGAFVPQVYEALYNQFKKFLKDPSPFIEEQPKTEKAPEPEQEQ